MAQESIPGRSRSSPAVVVTFVVAQLAPAAVHEPRSTRRGRTIAADWLKRIGFLFIGLAIQQAVAVWRQGTVDAGGALWLATWAALACTVTVAAFLLDVLDGR